LRPDAGSDERYDAALALIPIDCAAISYQLIDLKTAGRLVGLRRAAVFNFGCALRTFADRFATWLVLAFFGIRLTSRPSTAVWAIGAVDPAP
jgi:hypothetical protein